MTDERPCEFCDVIARRSPATVRYEDEETIVIENVLRWAPVMLLVIPKRHISQQEMWSDPIMARVGRIAVEVGDRFCPNGYRLLSNFGHDAMQSQRHGHLHVLGGMHLGPYA